MVSSDRDQQGLIRYVGAHITGGHLRCAIVLQFKWDTAPVDRLPAEIGIIDLKFEPIGTAHPYRVTTFLVL